MPSRHRPRAAHAVILLLAEIKSALEAFERGETNAFDAADAMRVAFEAYHAAGKRRRNAA